MTLVLLSRRTESNEADRLFNMVLPAVPDREALLAAARLALAALPPRDEKPVVPTSSSAHALKILVADDNRTNQKVIAKILERAGHAAMVVGDGEAALDALEASTFDVVLMDVNMPKMDGLEATKLYRMTELPGPRRPIIGLTADATPPMRERCLSAGMDACVIKPIEPQQLLQSIASFVPQESAPPLVAVAGEAEVTDIASHPQFRVVSPPVLDAAMLGELERLGGKEFVDDLVAGFLEDAAGVLEELETAWNARDAVMFRARAHAVCSGASNIGARRINDLCRPWSALKDPDIAEHGGAYVAELADELGRLRQHLAHLRTIEDRPG